MIYISILYIFINILCEIHFRISKICFKLIQWGAFFFLLITKIRKTKIRNICFCCNFIIFLKVPVLYTHFTGNQELWELEALKLLTQGMMTVIMTTNIS